MASAKPVLGIGALVAALALSVPASAQEPTPQCDGKDATIVLENWTEADMTTIDEITYETPEGTASFTFVGIAGTEGADVIVIGLPSPNFGDSHGVVLGLGGDDTICFSDDFIVAESAIGISIVGGAGNDTIFSQPDVRFRSVLIMGGDGDDILHGSKRSVTAGVSGELYTGGEIIEGGAGNDTIYGYQGYNILQGGRGNDTIYGGVDTDVVGGGSGDDTIYGAQGVDLLYGGPGRDTIFGGAGADVLASNDDFAGFHQEFRAGRTVSPPGQFSLTTQSFSQDTTGGRLFGGPGDDIILGSNRWDRLQGGPGNDTILGMEGRDWIRGGPGNDTILGGTGIDDINGNQGFDTIILQGADIGHGGLGQDTCLTGLNSTGTAFGLCERTGDITDRWPTIAEHINTTHEIEVALVE